MPHPPRVAVILAAGKGTRMKSSLPKVLHRAAGRPLLQWVVDAARAARCERILVVVGHGAERVREEITGDDLGWVLQAEQKGTGHALSCALPVVDQIGPGDELIVLCGDAPLIREETLEDLLALHRARHAGATILTADLDDPTGYGRIVRRPNGDVARIVEHKDASEAERALTEINSADYVFDRAAVKAALGKVTNDNLQGEYYLTDTIALLAQAGRPILALKVDDPREVLGVNTLDQLQAAEDAYLARGAGR